MKQQVNPVMAAAIAVGALVVVGLVVFMLSNRSSAPAQPTSAPVQSTTKNMSPDDVIKEHMKQMQQGGGGR